MSESASETNMPNKCPQCGATLPPGALEGLCPACLLRQGAETGLPPDSAPFQPPEVEEVARLFPQLEVLALLGKGGMGAVYKARQPVLDRLVALKILPPEAAGGPGFAERFNREARALARLNHPNIVGVFEFGQVNGLPFFIMEFVDGLNLRQLEQAGKLTPREALQIVPQICEALQFAHDEGIVHRDIKPENIMVDKKGRVKIADFGIAKILGKEQEIALTETKGAIGTPHYMAPEQMEHPASVDHRADIFSLGVVFYEMLTGELPLGKFSPPSSRKVEVDVRLDDVVLRALEKDPGRRYQHASQVKTAVDTIASTVAPPPFTQGTGMADEILSRGYELNIRSCFKRAWALVRSDFWPIIGVTALILALLAFASSAGGIVIGDHGRAPATTSILGMLVYGPLMGGLSLYYLKKIRREPTTIETAFSGFSHRFLHLFLAGFVTWTLTGLGFVCLILPGIYLIVAWWFTLTLVVDKQLDFWSAMEVSRKVVTRHWWKFLGFFLLVLLMYAVGFAFFIVGLLITAPVAMIAATYAYEDILGPARAATAPGAAGFGPSGTVVMPGVPPKQPTAGVGDWRSEKPVIIAVALAGLVVLTLLIFAIDRHRNQLRSEREAELAQQQIAQDSANSTAPGDTAQTQRETLKDRLDAAKEITDTTARDDAIVALATDAAKAGEPSIVEESLREINDFTRKNQTGYESVGLLAKHGMRKQALQIAKEIADPDLRNKALSDLAQ
jgi:predicted Ser/Thr protein kinase